MNPHTDFTLNIISAFGKRNVILLTLSIQQTALPGQKVNRRARNTLFLLLVSVKARLLLLLPSEVSKMALIPTDNITNLLQTYMDVQSRRTQVIAGNIANADTPGYIAKDLDFDSYLKDATRQASLPAARQGENALPASELRVIDKDSPAIGLDGNTVDAGREMSELAQAGMSFNFGAKMLQSHLRMMRIAIREGK